MSRPSLRNAPTPATWCASTSSRPGTYKKPESIAAWHATEGPGAVEEAWRKQSLDGGTMGEICSIAMLTDDGRDFACCRRPGESEAELLHEAFAVVELWTETDAKAMLPGRSETFPVDDHHLVAHNAAFDLGFLWRRSVVNDVPRPGWLPGPMARVGRDYTCTMQLWAGYGGRVSLDHLCVALGVPSPKNGAIDGAMVFDAWLEHRSAVIARIQPARRLRPARCLPPHAGLAEGCSVSGASRNKGKVGERELANLLSELTGWPVTRRVRQHAGDHDLEGIVGWCDRGQEACPRHPRTHRHLVGSSPPPGHGELLQGGVVLQGRPRPLAGRLGAYRRQRV